MLPRLYKFVVLAEQSSAHVGIKPDIELFGGRKTHQSCPIGLPLGGGRLQVSTSVTGELGLGLMNLLGPRLRFVVFAWFDVSRDDFSDRATSHIARNFIFAQTAAITT